MLKVEIGTLVIPWQLSFLFVSDATKHKIPGLVKNVFSLLGARKDKERDERLSLLSRNVSHLTLNVFFFLLFFTKGKTIDITWTVKNYGMGITAYNAWYDRVYLSKDDKRGCICTLLHF